MKYTREEINKIVDLKGHNGEQIDIFKLHGLLFVGNSEGGEWNLMERYTRFSEHTLPIIYEAFVFCETEEQVNHHFWKCLREAVTQKLI